MNQYEVMYVVDAALEDSARNELINRFNELVVKNGGNRLAFDPGKIKNGIIKACEKRPVSMSKIDKLVDDVKKQIYNSLEQEVTSKRIGELVMNGLKDIDEVAYVRYASVYRQFTDISSFMSELEGLMKESKVKKAEEKPE